MDFSQKNIAFYSIFNIQNLDVSEFFLERERERERWPGVYLNLNCARTCAYISKLNLNKQERLPLKKEFFGYFFFNLHPFPLKRNLGVEITELN
jgi:hypothetical protein